MQKTALEETQVNSLLYSSFSLQFALINHIRYDPISGLSNPILHLPSQPAVAHVACLIVHAKCKRTWHNIAPAAAGYIPYGMNYKPGDRNRRRLIIYWIWSEKEEIP